MYAAGDHFVGGELEVVGASPDLMGRSRRLIGLLIDRDFGLIAWAPSFVLLIPAVAWSGRRRLSETWTLLLPLAAGWAVATWVAFTMHGYWWPGRQLVHVLPLAVVLIARLVDGHRRLVAPFVAASLVALVGWVWLVVESVVGDVTVVADFFDTTFPIRAVFEMALPDHRRMGVSDVVLTAIWSAALVGAAAASLVTATGDRSAVRAQGDAA